MDEQFVFDAFISYSHKDAAWGTWLQRKLENWNIPSDIRKASGCGSKHLKVFRDQTDLAGVELQESIRRELRNSRFLVVICSPNSAASPWVSAEISYFKQLGRALHIIPFIVEGEPETDKEEIECYSEELRNVPDWHFLGANIQELGKQKALLRVISIILNVRFNRLVDRDRQRRVFRTSAIGSVTAAVLIVTSVLLIRNARIEKERRMLMYGNAIAAYAQSSEVSSDMIQMLQQSAEAGEAQSCLLLGDFYQNGRGVEEDSFEAFKWYEKAAELGNADGIVAVANCYARGTGVQTDMEQAFNLYCQAAEQGNLSGLFGEALCYRDGDGVEENAEKAFELMQRAAEGGHTLAITSLAYCYMSGTGTDANPELAFFWADKLARTGDSTGMYYLAMMFQNGYGTEESPQDALYWYRMAAEAGNADAMYMVGWCLENEYGTLNPALDWYKRAVEAGNSSAQEAVDRILYGQGQSN